MDNNNLKKCLKSYLMGKKLFDTDKDKSFEFFKQSLKYINVLKTQENIDQIVIDTEIECNKYINLTVEKTIEKDNDKIIDINLFDIIEKGDLSPIKNIKSYHLNFNVFDVSGNTPIHKAIKYGDTTFLKLSFQLGAPIDLPNKDGYTPLEIACLERDPNLISFLLKNGSDMKKHLLFRDGNNKNFSKQYYIDSSIILKIIFSYMETNEINDLKFIFNSFDINEKIGFNDYTYENLCKCLITLLNTLDNEIKLTYIKILREELTYPIKKSLGCPPNKIEIILVNLIPFIEYPFNITSDWLLNLELKYTIIKLIKEKSVINLEIKNELLNYLWDNYVKKKLIQDDYLGNLISQWVSKIK
jgi:hypothetical protein